MKPSPPQKRQFCFYCRLVVSEKVSKLKGRFSRQEISSEFALNVKILSGLPNANAKSPRFSYAISQIATLPPVVALNRSSKSQIAARYAAFWHAISQIALASFL